MEIRPPLLFQYWFNNQFEGKTSGCRIKEIVRLKHNDGPVLAEIKGEISNYYVSIEFDKNGKVWFKLGKQPIKALLKTL